MPVRSGMSIFHAIFVTDDIRLASLARGTERSNRQGGRLRITLTERRQPIISRPCTNDRLRIGGVSGRLGGAWHSGLSRHASGQILAEFSCLNRNEGSRLSYRRKMSEIIATQNASNRRPGSCAVWPEDDVLEPACSASVGEPRYVQSLSPIWRTDLEATLRRARAQGPLADPWKRRWRVNGGLASVRLPCCSRPVLPSVCPDRSARPRRRFRSVGGGRPGSASTVVHPFHVPWSC